MRCFHWVLDEFHENSTVAREKQGTEHVFIGSHIKELNNFMNAAQSTGGDVPMTTRALDMLKWVSAHEGGNQDHNALIRYYLEKEN